MPTKLHRYYGAGYLHFITTSCYRRSPLLGTPKDRDLFLEVMERVRRRYRFVQLEFRNSVFPLGVILTGAVFQAEGRILRADRHPVKRGLVKSPEQWRWSSYRFYLLGETGPVRANEGWTKLSFHGRAA